MPALNRSHTLRRLARRRRILILLSAALSQERTKRPYKKRATRRVLSWKEHVDSISPSVFKRAYRLDCESFTSLVEKIRPQLEVDTLKLRRGHSYLAVPVENRLAMALRYLAGGSYIDISFHHAVSFSYFYKSLWEVLEAIDHVEVVDFGAKNLPELKRRAAAFQARTRDAVVGCVGALDGLCVKIKEPTLKDTPQPSNFNCRKGFFCMNLQAICDNDYIFVYKAMNCVGSTHDSTAFECSSLSQWLEEHGLPQDHWIAGDDAYKCCDYLLTPFPGKGIAKDKDAFNFYQSSARIRIEQAFGMLVRRFGILWRPIETCLARVPLILSVCIKLHNICTRAMLGDGGCHRRGTFTLANPPSDPSGQGGGDYICGDVPCPTLMSDVAEEDTPPRRRCREQSETRDILCKHIQQLGLERPATSSYTYQ